MTVCLVVLLGLVVVQGYDLGDPSGLHFDVNSEYATSYENYKPRDYKFEYGVSDPHTGDHKSHWEVKENGVVRGEYSLLEPDGTTRVVQYTADDHGFRAVVKKIGHAIHPEPKHYGHDIHSSPVIVPELHQSHISEPYYRSYDGAAENYINVVDDSSSATLSLNGLNNHHEIFNYQGISLPQAEIHGIDTSLSLESHGNVPSENYQSVGIPSTAGTHGNLSPHGAESIIQSQPIISHQSEAISHIQPIHIQEPAQPALSHQAETIAHLEPIYIEQPVQPISSHQSQTIAYLKPSYIPEPVRVQQPIHFQEPIIQNPIHISEAFPLKSTNIISLKKEPTTRGIRIEHPHGESSSSFIGSTGNLEDDSAYTSYAKDVPIISWDSLGSKLQDSIGLSSYQHPIPYQYLQKRSIKKEAAKTV